MKLGQLDLFNLTSERLDGVTIVTVSSVASDGVILTIPDSIASINEKSPTVHGERVPLAYAL